MKHIQLLIEFWSNLLSVENVCVERIELSVFVAISLQSVKGASPDFAGQTEKWKSVPENLQF